MHVFKKIMNKNGSEPMLYFRNGDVPYVCFMKAILALTTVITAMCVCSIPAVK
jgi:hypothetical protein